MRVATYEAMVENGRIVLPDDLQLPERTRVYIVVPEIPDPPRFQIRTPRLRHPEEAGEFVKEVVEEPRDADV